MYLLDINACMQTCITYTHKGAIQIVRNMFSDAQRSNLLCKAAEYLRVPGKVSPLSAILKSKEWPTPSKAGQIKKLWITSIPSRVRLRVFPCLLHWKKSYAIAEYRWINSGFKVFFFPLHFSVLFLPSPVYVYIMCLSGREREQRARSMKHTFTV